MDGLLVIDKPVGPTSHDVVARVRRILGERRIGHTGTLDPGASGVLPLVVGRATRLARFLSAAEKSYDAVIRLGIATDTGDSAGTPVGSAFAGSLPGREVIARALDPFRGTFLQRPPVYSAKKIGGQRSHRLALEHTELNGRRGVLMERIETEWHRPLPELLTGVEDVEGDGDALLEDARRLAEAIEALGPVNPMALEEHAEELTRLSSHIEQFKTLLSGKEPAGRQLDFLVQEMHREVNTTGSKSQHREIAARVVAMKAELERVREQVQHVE